jgi:RNA polymerase sigma factor (sigma-70 family)
MNLPPFETVVDEHGSMVMRVCRAVLGSDDAAEDAWSETFISALRAYPDLRPGSDVRPWLVTIAHRKAIDQIRKRNRAPLPTEHPPERSSPDHAGEHVDAAVGDDLRSAVNALPTKQRLAVAYRYLADLSYADIAGLLDCSEAAARRSAADGIAALRSVEPSRSISRRVSAS